MTPSSPQYTALSLTDELAEATNELLDLGGGLRRAPEPTQNPNVPPLPTPSPLNLYAGGSTLSSLLALKDSSKLVLIYDDEEEEQTKKGSLGKARQPEVDSRDDMEQTFDSNDAEDDHLPSSRLNRMVASVSNVSSSSNESPASPRLPFRTDTEKKATKFTSSYKIDNETARADHTPSFFTESFPHFREESDVSGPKEGDSEAKVIRLPPSSSSTPSLALSLSEPAKATLGNVEESSITVKLHGNNRLQKEAQDEEGRELDQQVQDYIQHSDSPSKRSDDGDRSSLLSLPATAMTSSSQASSKGRRKLLRRRSIGSNSLAAEDLETMDDAPFARDVQVRGFTVVGEKSRGFVCYDVRVITLRGTTISILRRFSSFCQLRQSLSSERPQHSSLIPPLPPRRTGIFHKYASHHLEKRRRALQKWLAVVMLDRRWATTKCLREWVVGSSDEM